MEGNLNVSIKSKAVGMGIRNIIREGLWNTLRTLLPTFDLRFYGNRYNGWNLFHFFYAESQVLFIILFANAHIIS